MQQLVAIVGECIILRSRVFFFLLFAYFMLHTFCAFYIFIFCMCVKLQILIKNELKLNIRRGEGLGDGILFFLMRFLELGTHNLCQGTQNKTHSQLVLSSQQQSVLLSLSLLLLLFLLVLTSTYSTLCYYYYDSTITMLLRTSYYIQYYDSTITTCYHVLLV